MAAAAPGIVTGALADRLASSVGAGT